MQVLHYVLEARRNGKTETVSLPGADLRGAQLMRADMVGADLSGADLDHAQLAGSKLGNANLQGTLLRWADLNGADLTGADLRNADLSWARLEGSSLVDCDLRGASIERVVGEPSSIAGARIDKKTCTRSRLPDSEIIQLWRHGVILDDMTEFSMAVRRGCSTESAEMASDAGPPTRKLSDVEREARRERVRQDGQRPPSARVAEEVVRISLPPPDGEPGAPLSMRSLKLVAGILTPAMLAAPAWQEGDVLLGVTLEALIGEGNTARVWRGRSDDGELYAVKLFNTQRASIGLSLPAYRRGVAVMNRLTARGEAVGGVAELNAVSLNKLGFAMELAANGSAVDLPALGWSVKSVVEFFEKLCEAVASTHAVGALHRCLKPSNVLLDGDLNPLLTDFDMVDLPTLAAESGDAGGYTPYAAPEELLAAGSQSPTADIYSLGRILCFLLLGKHPAEPLADVPPLADLSEQPAGLSRIVRKCTMRAPEARYQWVSELLEDLRRYEDYEEVGVAGGASLENNYMPYRVSGLAHETPWLSREEQQQGSVRPASRRSKSRARARKKKDEAQAGWNPSHDKILGATGVVLLLVSMLAVELSAQPSASLMSKMHMMSVLAGAAATFLVPRFQSRPRIMRVVFALVAAAGLFLANLPSLFVPAGYAPLPPSATADPK